ncbi:MAG: hydrolase [Candidatus Omnitrophica bacterium]|nr:hydrolase [Candidatus Omnitrophota bacterium]
MPFTPFHFGAHACVALPLNKKTGNILVFLLTNVIIDIEPLLVIIFNFSYPLHGYAHTFIGASILGGIWGIIAYQFKTIFEKILKILKLPPIFSMKQYIISGILGALLHVLFDTPLYTDIKPFFPLAINPFYGLISHPSMYKICSLLFIPAMILYFWVVNRYRKIKTHNRSS